MKKIATSLFVLALAIASHAQEFMGWDGDYTKFCLVDSISASNTVQFWRVVPLNQSNSPSAISQTYKDINFKWTASYTVVGTVIPCRENATGTGSGSCNYNVVLENLTATDTIPANTINSISVGALTATVTVKTGASAAVTLDAAAKEVFSYTAPDPCGLIPDVIIIGISGGGNAHVAKSE